MDKKDEKIEVVVYAIDAERRPVGRRVKIDGEAILYSSPKPQKQKLVVDQHGNEFYVSPVVVENYTQEKSEEKSLGIYGGVVPLIIKNEGDKATVNYYKPPTNTYSGVLIEKSGERGPRPMDSKGVELRPGERLYVYMEDAYRTIGRIIRRPDMVTTFETIKTPIVAPDVLIVIEVLRGYQKELYQP